MCEEAPESATQSDLGTLLATSFDRAAISSQSSSSVSLSDGPVASSSAL